MRRLHLFRQTLLLTSVGLSLSSCLLPLPLGGLPFVGEANERFVLGHVGSRSKVRLKSVAFSAAMDANQNFATHVHLAVIYDPHMIAEFLKMPASKYFATYKQIQRDHHSTVKIFSFQVPPGGKIGPLKVDYDGSPVAAFLFAKYRTPGDHRIRIGDDKHIYIMLNKDDWQIMPNQGDG